MTCEMIIATVTCVATVIGTVIAVLSYLKNKNEQKIKSRQCPRKLDGFISQRGDDQINSGLSSLFRLYHTHMMQSNSICMIYPANRANARFVGDEIGLK